MIKFLLLFGLLTTFNNCGHVIYDFRDEPKPVIRNIDEDFSTAVTRMQQYARIANAAGIQQGLNTPSEYFNRYEVISELLNFGTVSPEEFRFFNLTELAEYVEGIRGFEKTLEEDPEVSRIEERLISLSELYKETRRALRHRRGIKAPEGYLEEAEKFRKKMDSVNWDRVITLVGHFAGISDGLPKMNVDDEFSSYYISYMLNSLLKNDFSGLSQLKSDILRQSKMFNPMSINELTKNFYTSSDLPFIAKLQSQVTLLANVIATSSNHVETFKKLKQVIVSRHHFSGNRKLTQTAGLPAGLSDLKRVFEDFDDPWVQMAVRGQMNPLKDLMSQLRTVTNHSDGILRALGSPTSESAVAIRSIYYQVLKLSKIDRSFPSAALNLVSLSTEAQSLTPPPGNIENFTQLHGNITEVANKLKAIDALLATADSFKNEKLADIKFIINLTATYSEENEKILKSSREFRDLFKTVSNLSDSIAILKKNSSIIAPLDTVIENYGEADIFLSSLKPFREKSEILRQSPGVYIARELIQVLREARKIKIESFDPVGKLIEDVTPKMEALREVLETKSPAAERFSGLPEVFLYSQVLGSAARVVMGIQKALGESGKISSELSQLESLRNEVVNETMPPRNLSSLLHTFLEQATEFKNSFRLFEDPRDMWEMYDMAKNVTGIPVDFLSMSETLEELAASSNLRMEILKIKNITDHFDTIGLDFAPLRMSANGYHKLSLVAVDKLYDKQAYRSWLSTEPKRPRGEPSKVVRVTSPPKEGDLTGFFIFLIAVHATIWCGWFAWLVSQLENNKKPPNVEPRVQQNTGTYTATTDTTARSSSSSGYMLA